MLRNLKVHPEIAIAFDLPTSHRACQVKGCFVSTRRGKAAERAEVERQVDRFLHGSGGDRDSARHGFRMGDLAVRGDSGARH